MSGKCFSCASQFGFFKKEVGCKNCGYAFCKDCLSHKVAVPKHNNEVHKVCSNCYKILTGQAKPENPAKYSPPEALRKRMEALEHKRDKPSTKKIHGTSHNQAPAASKAKYKGMSKEDVAIAERLQKLKDERKKEAGPVPSQSDIEKRLHGLKDDRPPPPSAEDMAKRVAVLKGQDPANVNKPHVFKKDTRSEQAQIDDLLAEIADEVEIDSHGISPAQDVQNRLDQLKGKDTSTPTNPVPKNVPTVSADHKTEGGDIDIEEMNKLMAKVAKEMELDARKAIADMEKDKDLMARLNQLKQERKERAKKGSNEASVEIKDSGEESKLENKFSHLQEEFSDSEDEEEAIKRILKQSLAEAAIDQEVEASGGACAVEKPDDKKSKAKGKKKETTESKKSKKSKKDAAEQDSDESYSDADEFPWCCICNNDATLRCIGCDYDLYCQRCYKEGHDALDMEDHKSFPFSPKKKKR